MNEMQRLAPIDIRSEMRVSGEFREILETRENK